MFPEWFRRVVIVIGILAVIFGALWLWVCPPCQLCIGIRFGQLCIEDADENVIRTIEGLIL